MYHHASSCATSSEAYETYKECEVLAQHFLRTDPTRADQFTQLVVDVVDTKLINLIRSTEPHSDQVMMAAGALSAQVSLFYLKMNVAAGIKHVAQKRFWLPEVDPLMIQFKYLQLCSPWDNWLSDPFHFGGQGFAINRSYSSQRQQSSSTDHWIGGNQQYLTNLTTNANHINSNFNLTASAYQQYAPTRDQSSDGQSNYRRVYGSIIVANPNYPAVNNHRDYYAAQDDRQFVADCDNIYDDRYNAKLVNHHGIIYDGPTNDQLVGNYDNIYVDRYNAPLVNHHGNIYAGRANAQLVANYDNIWNAQANNQLVNHHGNNFDSQANDRLVVNFDNNFAGRANDQLVANYDNIYDDRYNAQLVNHHDNIYAGRANDQLVANYDNIWNARANDQLVGHQGNNFDVQTNDQLVANLYFYPSNNQLASNATTSPINANPTNFNNSVYINQNSASNSNFGYQAKATQRNASTNSNLDYSIGANQQHASNQDIGFQSNSNGEHPHHNFYDYPGTANEEYWDISDMGDGNWLARREGGDGESFQLYDDNYTAPKDRNLNGTEIWSHNNGGTSYFGEN